MKVKNIGIYAHVDAGKTTITENLLYKTNVIKEIGRVDHGSSLTDNLELEKKRGISIQASPVSFYYKDTKINLVDTPGHADFIAEVEKSMNVLDGAILVISAKEGVQAQTNIIFDSLQKLNIPTIIFINKIDRIGVDIAKVVNEILDYLSSKAFVVQTINLERLNVSDLFHYVEEDLIDLMSTISDDILIRYIENSLTSDYLESELINHAKQGLVYPVIFGSALREVGVDHLLKAIDVFLPSLNRSNYGEPSGTVFKVKRNENNNKVYIRLYEGSLNVREYLCGEKITKLEKLENGKEIPTNELLSNDIGLVYGPKLRVNTDFGKSKRQRLTILEPTLKVEISPKDCKDRHKLLNALTAIAEEDPFLNYELAEVSNRIYINIFGEIQLEILKSRLELEFHLLVSFDNMQTVLREAPKSTGYSHVNLSDKRYPFYAEIGIKIEPQENSGVVEVVSEVSTGELLKTFQNGIFDGVKSYLDQGLKGWPLTNAKVSIIKGNYNSVNSTPSDFRNLAPIVLMQALEKAGTDLLWPILRFKLKVPSDALGKALSDLSTMQAEFNSPIQNGETCLIVGNIPANLCRNYELTVRAYTAGKGLFSIRFSHFAKAPKEVSSIREKPKVDPLNETIYLMHKRGIL